MASFFIKKIKLLYLLMYEYNVVIYFVVLALSSFVFSTYVLVKFFTHCYCNFGVELRIVTNLKLPI